MIRYLVIAASALTMLSGAALAQSADIDAATGSKTVISRTGPAGIAHKRVIIRHRINHRGKLVTRKKIIREGLTGSSVTRVRKSTDPMTGVTTRERSTELR